jgi:hypothetical protein
MENSTDYLNLLQSFYSDLAFGCTLLIIIVAAIGVIGNLSVILIYFRIKDGGERYFIPLLAVVDLLACVASFPYIVINNAYNYNYPSEFACRLFCMLRLFLPGISAFVFLLISVQRYLLVCRPFGPEMTLSWKRFSFALACGIAFAGTSPILGTSGILTTEEIYLNTNITVRICKFSVEFSYKTMVYFGIIILAMVACVIATISLFIIVLKRVKTSVRLFQVSNVGNKNNNRVVNNIKLVTFSKPEQIKLRNVAANDASSTQISGTETSETEASQGHSVQTIAAYPRDICDEPTPHSTFPREQDGEKIKKTKTGKRKRESVQRRLTVMFFLLILVFIISYIPPLLILILTYTIEDFNYFTLSNAEALVWIYLPNLVFLNHMINPLIYGYYDSQFRKQLVLCFKR